MQRAVIIGLSDGLRNSGGRLSAWTQALNSSAVEQFTNLIEQALQTIKDKKAATSQVKQALRLLENASGKNTTIAILDLLDRFPPAPIQVAAVQTLSRCNASDSMPSLLTRWSIFAPEARREALSVFLAKKERIDLLLEAIERGRIAPGELDAIARSALLRHSDKSIQRRAVALLGEEKAGTRNEIIQKFGPALNLRGDARSGQDSFKRLCSSCHRLSGIANELGPNLALASTRSPDELLVNILDPNRDVDPAYVLYNIETIDGETVSGLIVADHPESVTLKGVGFERSIPRQQIRKIASSDQSLMPVGLEQGLGLQDMADLLSFLMESQYDLGTSGQSSSRDVPERR